MNTPPTDSRPRPAATSRPSHGRSGAVVLLAGVDVDVAGTPVLREVDVEIGPGEVVGLVGPNGSGKSTLLSVMATLLRPVRGGGRVLEADLGSVRVTAVRPSIALVGHAPALYSRLTLAENLRFVARLTGRPEPRADRALDAVGLGAAGSRKAVHCSQGMLRRAELARVLLVEPRLLLLDEAHAGLDESSAGLVDVVVADVRGRGGASVLVSHERVRLLPLVDRVIEIVEGRTAGRRAAP